MFPSDIPPGQKFYIIMDSFPRHHYSTQPEPIHTPGKRDTERHVDIVFLQPQVVRTTKT